eukprot:1677483-Prymnesium_polylepis.1
MTRAPRLPSGPARRLNLPRPAPEYTVVAAEDGRACYVMHKERVYALRPRLWYRQHGSRRGAQQAPAGALTRRAWLGGMSSRVFAQLGSIPRPPFLQRVLQATTR